MKIATWNVNSLRVRLGQVLSFLSESGCDVLMLQETKLTDEAFPAAELKEAGFSAVFSGQKTYNGTALVARDSTVQLSAPVFSVPGYPDPQKRLTAATACVLKSGRSVRLISAYFPNGAFPGSRKFLYKLEWIAALRLFLAAELQKHPDLVLGGDFNIAPEDRDCWNPELWKGNILVSAPERDAFRSLLALGFEDAFRAGNQESVWSWWDYRGNAFLKNQGLRIDHVLASSSLAPKVRSAAVEMRMRGMAQPSDHAPVTVTLQV